MYFRAFCTNLHSDGAKCETAYLFVVLTTFYGFPFIFVEKKKATDFDFWVAKYLNRFFFERAEIEKLRQHCQRLDRMVHSRAIFMNSGEESGQEEEERSKKKGVRSEKKEARRKRNGERRKK